MTDDGMLLNFSVGESIIAPKPVLKGGNWKARLTAKKAARYGREKYSKLNGADPADTQGNPNRIEVDPANRESKRQRTDGEFKPAAGPPGSNHTSKINGAGSRDHQQQQHQRAAPKQIISSLFTYNPASTAPAQSHANEEEVDIAPSNAPLSSELDTFTSLGLSSALAEHLLNKMNIKAPTAIQKAAIPKLLQEGSDAFVQAQTGSGKTLAYLLPIVQSIMKLSPRPTQKPSVDGKETVHRDSGLFAIILAPTRELAKQIVVVLESLLRCAHWIVSTTVTGGEKKKSEKARLRKGVNILVATPGRLADHLDHTEVLDVSTVRWLVLDEGDRLMELGFEQEIQKIIGNLNLRMKGSAGKAKIPGLPDRRMTILCSATLKVDVQRLGEISLKEANHIQASPEDKNDDDDDDDDDEATHENTFSAPAQLTQSYIIVPAKQRLVTLIGFLKRSFIQKGRVMKAIVFISCADSVDFHFEVLTKAIEEKAIIKAKEESGDSVGSDAKLEKDEDTTISTNSKGKLKAQTATIPISNPAVVTHAPSSILSPSSDHVTVYRLHGSLAQPVRTSTLRHFSQNEGASVLLATDVASRGLDLPNVDLVIEYDPAFSREDHLHRIGRTARAGRPGRACIFLLPGCEEGYVDILSQDRPRQDQDSGNGPARGLARHTSDEILQRAFAAPVARTKQEKGAWADRATELQLDIERWALANPQRLDHAKRAFQGHVRAYATHVTAERGYFDIKELHLGHLAKAFALRDRPGAIHVAGLRASSGKDNGRNRIRGANGSNSRAGVSMEEDGTGKTGKKRERTTGGADDDDIAAKMRRMVRSKGSLKNVGASEFNLG